MARSKPSGRGGGIGLGFTGDPYEVRKLVSFAGQAEKNDYGYFFMCEDYYLRDAVTTLACVAYETKKLKLSTGVVNPYTRNPILTALTMSTLNELAKGRMILTLGSGVQPLLESMGVKFERPLRTMEEAVELIRLFQTGKAVQYGGEVFNVKGVRLGENPYFGMDSFKPSSYPVFVAAMGPKMLQLAGRIGDGSLFSAGFGVPHAKEAVSQIAAGASAAGRSVGGLDVACYILSCLGKPSKAVRKFVAWEVAYSRPEFLAPTAVSQEKAAEVREALTKKGESKAIGILSDDEVRSFAACGTKGEIQSIFDEYRKVGVTIPVLVPLETETAQLIRSIS